MRSIYLQEMIGDRFQVWWMMCFGFQWSGEFKLSNVCEWFIVADGGEAAESQKP